MAPIFAKRAQSLQQQQQQALQTEVNARNDNDNKGSRPLKVAQAKFVDGSTMEGSDKRTRNGKFTLAQLRQTDGIVPLQAGTNQYDSQKGMTGFGTPRDVKGKHLKRIWELEFPEEAITDAPPVSRQEPLQQ